MRCAVVVGQVVETVGFAGIAGFGFGSMWVDPWHLVLFHDGRVGLGRSRFFGRILGCRLRSAFLCPR